MLHAAPEIATQLDLSSVTTPTARKFYFETTPGQRYSLWRSTDLRTWQEVAGFPKVADGMSLEHTFAQQDKEFFQIEAIDEQAPTVVSQYPAVDGFALGRFADLSIQLDDATGINPASIRLTVGASGQMAPGAPGLTISGNTITYDSGDAAFGAWGVTISATLIAADTLGHTPRTLGVSGWKRSRWWRLIFSSSVRRRPSGPSNGSVARRPPWPRGFLLRQVQ